MNQPQAVSEINSFLDKLENSLIHYSPQYLDVLSKALDRTSIHVIETRESGELSGLLPVAIYEHPSYGVVLNSLPFFGSHGGPICGGNPSLQVELITKYSDLIREFNAISATIVESPFELLSDELIASTQFEIVDDRIGQITNLPCRSVDTVSHLFSLLHVKTRNAVRKGQKLNLVFEDRTDDESWAWMQEIHQSSIHSLGGVAKSLKIFDAFRSSLGSSIRLHTASYNGSLVAGLVYIKYRNMIEYFTPVVDPEFRDSQALSALIFEVMQLSVHNGFSKWNWGGTWRAQEGVYRFKRRWGAADMPYRYLNWVRDPSLRQIGSALALQQFPHYYLFKF